MIPHGVEVFVGLEPIDLRWSFDRLAGIAHERVGRNGRSGALCVFFGKRRTALKIFFADATGVCIFYNQPSSHYTDTLIEGGLRQPALGDGPFGGQAAPHQLGNMDEDLLALLRGITWPSWPLYRRFHGSPPGRPWCTKRSGLGRRARAR